MGRSPPNGGDGLNKGAWTAEEDEILTDYVKLHGVGRWSSVAKRTNLKRCGKSCRLRWMNYLRPDIKRGNISCDEEDLIIRLHKLLGNRWSLIAGRLPGRTDNEIKNYWNTNLARKIHESRSSQSNHERGPRDQPHRNLAPTNTSVREGDGVLAAPEQLTRRNNDNVAVGEAKLTKEATTEHKYIRNESPTSISDKDSSSDFVVDFNVDDIYRLLETDFTRPSENQADDFNGHKRPEKMEDNWGGGAERAQGDVFLSLASLFLESAGHEEWLGEELNIDIHASY